MPCGQWQRAEARPVLTKLLQAVVLQLNQARTGRWCTGKFAPEVAEPRWNRTAADCSSLEQRSRPSPTVCATSALYFHHMENSHSRWELRSPRRRDRAAEPSTAEFKLAREAWRLPSHQQCWRSRPRITMRRLSGSVAAPICLPFACALAMASTTRYFNSEPGRDTSVAALKS